jgi:cysteine desulfurase/selenocysteine lyase
VSSAALRAPTAPTLPDGDPLALTSYVARLANELFAMPPAPVDGFSFDEAEPAASEGLASRPGGPPSQGSFDSVQIAPPTPVAPAAPAGPSAITATTATTANTVEASRAALSPGAVSAPNAPNAPQAPNAPSFPSSIQGSPFDAPLDFSVLGADGLGGAHDPLAELLGRDGLRFPLFDAPVDSSVAPSPPVHVPVHEPAHPSPHELGDSALRAPDAKPGAAAPTGAVPSAFTAYEITPTEERSIGSLSGTSFDPHALKREFPILREQVNGRPLVWLDNAATTQKPQTVIDRLSHFYAHENSNIHRAAHTLAARATDAYESARESVRRFVNAPSVKDVIFVRGATEGINLVAQSWGRRNVQEGDEIVISWLEHHANIVPWQQLCAEKRAKLRVAPVDDHGQIILEEYEKLLGPKTRLVSVTQVSNALGTITPAKAMVEMAHRHGALALVDGAQAVSHKRVDVQDLGADFYVFSGHKVFAPTGIGAVVAKSEIMDETPPWQGGGNMIRDVTFERTQFHPSPARFEAGTGNIADAVGLGAALDWLTRVGIERVEHYEHELLVYGTERLRTVPGLHMIGTAREKAGVLSFVLDGQKTEEVGGMLDREGIAVRSGHHCAQPILRRFGVEASVRASLAPYNTREDLDALVAALRRIQAGQVRLG